ncbi:MAG: hypothetical protein KGH57_02370 [Candidatus Micrarchaeota archaeon]|nr:hypothetical protein [Candidatus Micrarchaeota archaeon]
MALVSEKKQMDLQRTMLVIRRCPFCLKDTEQNAYYAHRPDLRIIAALEGREFALEYQGRMPFEWYGIAECRECGNAYVVQGAIPQINKDITGVTKRQEVTLAYTCCDFCLREERTYALANMLITLRNGAHIYLCERHSDAIKKEKGRRDSYDFLIPRVASWKA